MFDFTKNNIGLARHKKILGYFTNKDKATKYVDSLKQTTKTRIEWDMKEYPQFDIIEVDKIKNKKGE